MALDIEQQVVFMVGPTNDGKPPLIMLGMTEGSWSYMEGGMTHGFDLTKIGIPVRILIFRGKDHSDVMATVEGAAKAGNFPILDERRKDFRL